jgi:DNA-binding transcriptional LysR family regulator
VIFVQGNFTSNHLDLIKQMVLDNLCIAILPKFMVANELQTEKIKPCLTSYQLPESPIYAVYPERKFKLPKLKTFLEMLKAYLNEQEQK